MIFGHITLIPAYKLHIDSNIVKEEDFDTILEWFPDKKYKFQLLYRASQDGYTAKAFHDKCDWQSNVISFIRSKNGKVFGGYSSIPWVKNSSNTYIASDNNFIFSLTNKVMMPIKNNMQAIYSGPSYGVTFGGGHDIYICDNSNN